MIYRYRAIDATNGTDVLGAASCRIPRTPEAIRLMDRRLGVSEPRENGKGHANAGRGEITTQSCPQGGCPIERLIAYGYAIPGSSYPGGSFGWDQGGWGSSYYESSTGTWPDPPIPGEPCRTGDPFLDDARMNVGFDEMWQGSNPTANIAHRTEQIGWIVRTETGYRIEVFGTGDYCGWEGNAPFPEEGRDAVVGFIHTHPYAVGEVVIACDANGNRSVATYTGTPSDIDRNTAVQLGQELGRAEPLAGLILDASGIRTFKGWDLAMDGHISRCGY